MSKTTKLDAEALLDLIREEASKDNSPLGRSDGYALRRIREALDLDPHTGLAAIRNRTAS